MMAVMAGQDRDERRDQRRRRVAPVEGTPADLQEVPGWSGRIMVWLRWIAQIIGIQIFIVLGTLLGLVIAGLGPALASGGALLARLLDGDASDQLWKDFWAGYRAQFRRGALVTAPALLVVALAWYEMLVLQAHGTGAVTAILTGTTAALALYATAYLGYAPSVLRRYTDGPARTSRFLLVAPLVSPLTALGCMVTVVAFVAVTIRWPFLLVLAGVSVPLLLTGMLVDRFLDKVDARDEEAPASAT